ncbi:Hsp20/alpha crystallin family protein [Spongiactinospora sp. TRM90649]|uniref:Hsp20/alpha crystallin family protein n=1 Tax=Spongiactinospora sp. TRM90649 TaxID=3031114 RepID=UPI0023F6A8CF|nr:Hsp20/alpha crystallin family protein [Spongiactinospora sp. TRM90649]MDF5755219.1 Hsp20/alpha crystallin family protein [Spongiactinospora sp. TRM90649]
MSTITRRDRGLLPEIFDLLEAPFAGLRPGLGHPIRFEDYIKDGRYILLAELPGTDPGDIELTVAGGVLTLHAERHHEEKETHRSEFRYGSLTRSIALPPHADEDDITATHHNGILTISVRLADDKQAGKRIPIATTASE